MEHLQEKSKTFLIEDIKKNPGLITDFFFNDYDVSMILEKKGNKISFSYFKKYSNEAVRIFDNARQEYNKLKSKGYNKEQAYQDFINAQEEISKY